MADEKYQIYIIVSQTGTILSRILKFITKAEYNHASISICPDLTQMYSFGRLNPYNPFIGGFVKESPKYGTFKRFRNTKVAVLAIDVDAEVYEKLCKKLLKMYAQRKLYHYNYLGLFLAGLHICRKKTRCFYCSEFVRDILKEYEIEGSESLKPITQPVHFLSYPNARLIYTGELRNFNMQKIPA